MCKFRFFTLSRLVLPSLATFFNTLLWHLEFLVGDKQGANAKAALCQMRNFEIQGQCVN
jgi:hypothetical protein